ncbi:MAG: type II secretion system F family protein [Verrucomicrobia bacterium]|nr:type II secretion system F family protein [Verrucomicrobiota bacterium]
MISDRQKHQARFWRKYLRLTRGRISTLRALEIIIREKHDAVLVQTLGDVLQALKSGASFKDAFSQHPTVFSPSILELLKSAEDSGAWDDILEEIAAGLEDGTFD